MRTLTAFTFAAVTTLSAAAAFAQEASVGVFVAPQISTLGLGAEAGYRINEHVGIRGGGNAFTFSRNINVDDIDYDGDLTLKSFGAMADVYPFGGGFHVTGGLRLNYNKADVTGTPSGSSYTINGVSYSTAEVGRLEGDIDFRRVAPYLGLGWNGSLFSPNLYVGADLGVLFQGRSDVSLRATNPTVSAALASDIEQARRDLKDEVDDFRFYPVLSVSIGYRF
jgi:hypothetical protein